MDEQFLRQITDRQMCDSAPDGQKRSLEVKSEHLFRTDPVSTIVLTIYCQLSLAGKFAPKLLST